MLFNFELFSDESGQKHVFISTDGASGAHYPYENANDIGKAIAFYMSHYYPDIVKTPEPDEP